MGRRRRHNNSQLLERRTRSFNPQYARDALELLDMCVKALQDKGASTREKALAALASALEELPPLAELDNRCYHLFALCGVCIRDGSPKEERLAYRATGLLAVTLRFAAPWFLVQSLPRLASTIHGQDDAPTVVEAALDCLAAVTLAGARGKEDVERSIQAVWDLVAPSVSRPSKITGDARAAKASPQALAGAVSTWAFFITTIVSVTDAHRKADWNAAVASLAGLLDNDDRAVRMAAGEALAVCVELNLMTSWKGVDALAAKVSELASEAPDRGSNNAMLPEQKDLFREIAAFLDRGERPEKSMPTSQDGCVALEVSTWAKHVQLKFLTRFLGNGFVKHVQGNELFVEAFSYGANEGKVLSIANKKQSSNVDKDLELKRDWSWRHWNIFCRYPYTANRKPESLLQIGWQAPNYKEQKNR